MELSVYTIIKPINLFCFDTVIINMHGNVYFNSALKIVYKYDTLYNLLTSDIKICVDNLRTAAARRATSRLQFLGIQDNFKTDEINHWTVCWMNIFNFKRLNYKISNRH